MWIEGKLDVVGAIALGFAILHVSFFITDILTTCRRWWIQLDCLQKFYHPYDSVKPSE